MPQGTQPDSRPEIGRLMEQYGSSLLRMSALYLKDADLAQDAVQETFIKAYRHFSEYRGESSEKTWLTSICMNTCRDMLRTAWFRHNSRIDPDTLPEQPAGDRGGSGTGIFQEGGRPDAGPAGDGKGIRNYADHAGKLLH